ncbi:MAG: T9SS type A sorting domain-containing protein [Flavobacteriales bacterium]
MSINFFLFFLSFTTISAQIVNIPDDNFKNALLFSPVVDTNGNGLGDSIADLNGDGEIQVSEAEAIFSLIISYYEISSLEGIENFTNLEILKCRGNFIENINLSSNLNLRWLHLSTNPLVSIDVSHNLQLQKLWVYNNQLIALDVSQNPNLNSLRCYTNNLVTLNISNNNNEQLTNFLAYENPNLNCIKVDDVEYAINQTQWQIDDGVLYSEDCNLGINNNSFENFAIYPNPIETILYIKTKRKIIEKIKIINLQGEIIKEKYDSNKINVSNLVSGLYFVSIHFNGKIKTKIIIKN